MHALFLGEICWGSGVVSALAEDWCYDVVSWLEEVMLRHCCSVFALKEPQGDHIAAL